MRNYANVNNLAQSSDAISTLGTSTWTILFFAVALFFLSYSSLLIYHWFKRLKLMSALTITLCYSAVGTALLFLLLSTALSLTTL